jgi:dethiobiotin synthetase
MPQSVNVIERTPANRAVELAIVGTDTSVGKTFVTKCLAQGLRSLGRHVWLHKPIACGGWSDGQAEDSRILSELVGDGQLVETICPLQYPEPASPHLAAELAGDRPTVLDMVGRYRALRGPHDLIVESAGGLLTPIDCERQTVADLIVACALPVIIVTRPDLGTLNHTALTVNEARRRSIPILGMVVSHARPPADSYAVRSACRELTAITGIAVLAELAYSPNGACMQSASNALAIATLQHLLCSPSAMAGST